MTWKRVVLTNRQVKEGHLDRMLQQWPRLVVASGNPKLPSPMMGDRQKDGTTAVYFPPETSPAWDDFLTQYDATPCGPPAERVTPMGRMG